MQELSMLTLTFNRLLLIKQTTNRGKIGGVGLALLKRTILLFTIIFSAGFNTVYADSSYPVLEKHINQQKYKQAYQQATKLLAQNEGDPRFDYLYGLSALQTGHYNEAVFALDRVTILTPRVIRPRLELARAYLKLNNKRAAIKEFNDVLNLSPPPIVRQKVTAYISELEKGNQQVQKSVTKRLASFSIGYDDNINFGYSSSDIDLPLFGVVTLNPSAVKQSSGFAEAKFQIRRRNTNSNKSNTFVSANLTHRKYFKDTDFNFTDVDLRAGITLNRNKNQYQFVVRDRPVFLDDNLHSNTLGVDAIARKALGSGKVASVSLGIEDYRNNSTPLSDRKRAQLGASWDKNNGDLQHQISLNLGSEWADDSAGKQFSRDIAGVGYKLTRDWNEKNKTSVNVDYRRYKHKAPYALFPDTREDDRVILGAVHEWQLSNKTAILFSARHINNNSNIELYDAKRNEIQVGVRYEWD